MNIRRRRTAASGPRSRLWPEDSPPAATRSRSLARIPRQRRRNDATVTCEWCNWPLRACRRSAGSSITFGRLLGRKVTRSLRWLEQRGFAAAAGCVAVSRFIARETAADFGLYEECIPVIPNAIDPFRFSPPPDATRDDRLVVYIGT